jgi:hypothetical protein
MPGEVYLDRSADVTTLLKRLAGGDQDAVAQLIPLIYNELRHLAVRHLRHQRAGHTLEATGRQRPQRGLRYHY